MTGRSRNSRTKKRSAFAERVVSIARNLLIALGIGVVTIAIVSVRRGGIPDGVLVSEKDETDASASKRVAIVAGHWQYDSGAVCPDGLREVDINLDVARAVALMLREKGYIAEVLPEYSRKLNGYQALALVSLHTDSCVHNVTGFKVATKPGRRVSDLDDLLVECLYTEYARVTGLARHESSITIDMTQYHAFSAISAETPAAIIELGFMGSDREILISRQDLVAEGVVEGILCFLNGINDSQSEE